MPASPFERGGDDHEFVDPFWMAKSSLQSNGTTKREAKEISLFFLSSYSNCTRQNWKTVGTIVVGLVQPFFTRTLFVRESRRLLVGERSVAETMLLRQLFLLKAVVPASRGKNVVHHEIVPFFSLFRLLTVKKTG
jgi:hypothetical protein